MKTIDRSQQTVNFLTLVGQVKGGTVQLDSNLKPIFGGDLADPILVKRVAKDALYSSIKHLGWNAMMNSKPHLRKAAISGRFDDLPGWLKDKVMDCWLNSWV